MEKIMESVLRFLRLDNFVENLSGYLETRVELIKTEVREEVARVISHGLVSGVLVLLGILFLAFASIGLAIYMNTFFVNSYGGFWIVSGLYALLGLIIFFSRRKIYTLFEHHLIEQSKRKNK